MASKTKQNCLKKYILIGRCECDGIVSFPFFWAEELIPFAKTKNFDVIDLKRENFCKDKIKTHIEEKNPSIIFLNGHGDEFSVRGYLQEQVIILGENDHLFNGKIAHIISCKTALFLGQSMKDKGCIGFLGYNGPFHIETDYNPEKDKDMIANFFKEGVNSASRILIGGGSVKEAYEKSQEIYKKNIEFCKGIYFTGIINFNIQLSDEKRDMIGLAISALEKNKDSQVYL